MGDRSRLDRRRSLLPLWCQAVPHLERFHSARCRHGPGLHPGLRPPPALDGLGDEIWQIGKAVTRRARAFGMKIYGTDIIPIDHVFIAETGIEMMDLKALLANSDFIS